MAQVSDTTMLSNVTEVRNTKQQTSNPKLIYL